MRLLLDEHLAPEIARRLRSRGHDVDAVAERPELVSLSDGELFARMAVERRAILTNDVPDCAPEPAPLAPVMVTSGTRSPRMRT